MRAIALRHVGFEDLGVWASTLRERGYDATYLEAGEDLSPAREAELVVVLGAPIGLGDQARYPFLSDEIDLVRARLDEELPTLGVCLGAQIMAAALGARVYPAQEKEIGWGRLALAAAAQGTPVGVLADAPVLHWHGDTFDLPEGSTLLASTTVTAHQAFSWRNSLALQCHVEASGLAIERWLVGHAVELRAAGVDVPRFRTESLRHALASARAGRAFLHAYLDTLTPERAGSS